MPEWWGYAVTAGWAIDKTIAGMCTFLPAPRPDDSTTYRVLYAFCNAVSLNFGDARNAAQPAPQRIQPS
jgi:hypothetical protein